MKEITRQTTIIEYQTSDGKMFSEYQKDQAQFHQDVLDGKIISCSVCDGTGGVPAPLGDDFYGYACGISCDECIGNGYLYKQ